MGGIGLYTPRRYQGAASERGTRLSHPAGRPGLPNKVLLHRVPFGLSLSQLFGIESGKLCLGSGLREEVWIDAPTGWIKDDPLGGGRVFGNSHTKKNAKLWVGRFRRQ